MGSKVLHPAGSGASLRRRARLCLWSWTLFSTSRKRWDQISGNRWHYSLGDGHYYNMKRDPLRRAIHQIPLRFYVSMLATSTRFEPPPPPPPPFFHIPQGIYGLDSIYKRQLLPELEILRFSAGGTVFEQGEIQGKARRMGYIGRR